MLAGATVVALAAKGAWVLPLLAPKPNPELGVEGKDLLALLKEKVVGLKFAPGEDDAAAEDILPPVAPAKDVPKLKPPPRDHGFSFDSLRLRRYVVGL